MDIAAVPDPHVPFRGIFRIIIVIVTMICVAGGAAALILFAMSRKAIIWRICSFAISISQDDEYDVLKAEGITTISNNLVYVSLCIIGTFTLLSIFGCGGAAFHKRVALNLYSVIMGIFSVVVVVLVILLLTNQESTEEEIHTFGNMSLEKGFTGRSNGVDDVKPGGAVTYMWQWMQVKYKCCGWYSGDDYKKAKVWNKTTKVFNISRFDPVTANKMLTLENRVALITNTGTNKVELIALEQILPPSCCKLVSTNNKNAEAIRLARPKNFSNLVLEDFTCPHTREGSLADQGCYNAFLTVFNKNIYAIVGGSAAAAFMLVVTVFFAHKLAQYPTSDEWQEETANESAAQDTTIYDPTGGIQQPAPIQDTSMNIQVITADDSKHIAGSTRSRRSKRRSRHRNSRKKKWKKLWPFGRRR